MTKKHPKVETAKAARQAAIDALHYRAADGSNQPLYAPNLMTEKMREIDAQFEGALQNLMESADKQHTAAEMKLAAVNRPYDWLTADELKQAATLAPFIREDFGAMDAAGLVDAVKSAATTSRVEKWLAWRYAPQRAAELETDPHTAPMMSQRAHIEQGLAALRDGVMLPSQRKEHDDAARQLDDAQTLFDAAEWARPSVRQELATRWNVKPEYLPD